MSESNGTGQKQIQSLARAMQIIDFIVDNRNSASLTQISRGLGLSKSTVHGLISTLEQHDYVFQDQVSGHYQLGLKLFELGQVVYERMDLRSIAYPILLELSEKHQETVHLAVLSGAEVVYIDKVKVDSPQSVGVISQVGGRNPTYCTGVGKVLLSGLSEAEVEKLIREEDMKKITPNTLDTMVKLKEALADIRQKGVAYDLEEIELGLRCVAAPIRNHKGEIIAGISLSGPAGRMPDERMAELSKDVIAAGRRISAKLGYRG